MKPCSIGLRDAMGVNPLVIVIELLESLKCRPVGTRPNRNVVQLNHGYTGQQANSLADTQSS
jgi:hypothetical protein